MSAAQISTAVAIAEWIGARETQQDHVAAIPRATGKAIVLADGMGGHKGGEIASRIVCQSITAVLKGLSAWDNPAMRAALDAAHAQVKRRATGELESMGATALAVSVNGSGIAWLSVGDSPLLLVRARKTVRLNADHSYGPILDEMVRRGELSPAEGERDPKRSALRSVVSARPIALCETRVEPDCLQPGDVVIAASDGLLTLDADEIANVAGDSATARAAARGLVAAVRARNVATQDNVSVAVFVTQPSRVRKWGIF